jgi:hypothetical protein
MSTNKLNMVVHICNPSYVEGIGWRSEVILGKSKTLSEKELKQKNGLGVGLKW